MNEKDMNEKEINEEKLEKVTGGTFVNNTFSDNTYRVCGIKVTRNIIWPDEFVLPDGTKTDMEGADRYVETQYSRDVLAVLYWRNNPNAIWNPYCMG